MKTAKGQGSQGGVFLFFNNIMTKLYDSWGSKICEFPEIFMNSEVTKQCLEASSREDWAMEVINNIHRVLPKEMSSSRLSALHLLAHLIFTATL